MRLGWKVLARFCLSLLFVYVIETEVFADSVLHFPEVVQDARQTTGLSVTNPTPYFADVKFTLYDASGQLVSAGVLNPVQYRLAPGGQLSMTAVEIFNAGTVRGWVRVTSTTTGLTGFYLSGDFQSMLDGAVAPTPLDRQIIPSVREDRDSRTALVLLNPADTPVSVGLSIFGSRGEAAGSTTLSLGALQATEIAASSLIHRLGSPNYSAAVISSLPVIATARIESRGSLVYLNGQALDQPATTRIVPHVVSGGGIEPTLYLANPGGLPSTVTVTLLSATGGPVHVALAAPSAYTTTIPANGSVVLSVAQITGLLLTPLTNGWIRIDSDNVVLGGVVLLDQGSNLSAMALERAPQQRFMFQQFAETDGLYTGFAFLNPSAEPADFDVTFLDQTGEMIAQQSVRIPARTKVSRVLRELFGEGAEKHRGTLLVRSAVPIYGVEVFGASDLRFSVSSGPHAVTDAFTPSAAAQRPEIIRIEPAEAAPGTTLRINTRYAGTPVSFVFGSQLTVAGRRPAPGGGLFLVEVPEMPPGFVTIRMNTPDGRSIPFPITILPADRAPMQTVGGRAFYQKIELRDDGLDFSLPTLAPIRNAGVEVVDRGAQTVLSVSETDEAGRFRLLVPFRQNLAIRIESRLRSAAIRVLDNTSRGSIYSLVSDLDPGAPSAVQTLVVPEVNRLAGAFNILEMIRRGTEFVERVDRSVEIPQLDIFWSPRNSPRSGNPADGSIGATFFNVSNNTAFILGDRATDADEFDDGVIIHEYAHFLAARFSRDDSQGGRHVLGDILDPRVAWSEGLANYFAAAVRNDPIYRDLTASGILRFDLDRNVPDGDRPGYWSEYSVHSVLWDIFDDSLDEGDALAVPFETIWAALRDLQQDRFVYLSSFLERLLDRNKEASAPLRAVVQLRSVDFRPDVRPSVTNPFPRPIDSGEAAAGEVDSITHKRFNLMQAAHFFAFRTAGGLASIRLDVTGLGVANDPRFNDLDLFLMDLNGRVLERSDRGLNGQSELISLRLPAGTYVVEVRSFYTRGETGERIYNSGRYRLALTVQ